MVSGNKATLFLYTRRHTFWKLCARRTGGARPLGARAADADPHIRGQGEAERRGAPGAGDSGNVGVEPTQRSHDFPTNVKAGGTLNIVICLSFGSVLFPAELITGALG